MQEQNRYCLSFGSRSCVEGVLFGTTLGDVNNLPLYGTDLEVNQLNLVPPGVYPRASKETMARIQLKPDRTALFCGLRFRAEPKTQNKKLSLDFFARHQFIAQINIDLFRT